MKSSKIWRIIWIVGVFMILLILLYLIVLYKVKWESKDFNTYLYFYDCGRELCTSQEKVSNYYNRIICDESECPYIDTIIDDNLILRSNNNAWIYNYINDRVIDNKYADYRYIGNDMYVVMNSDSRYGIIDGNGDIIVNLNYDYIDDYSYNLISYINNNLYGIISVDREYDIQPMYEDVVLINDKIFAGRIDNVYQLHSYTDIDTDNSNKYNYVYSYDGIMLVASDKRIDILDNNLKSTLLMKIDTFYEYTTGQERDSLDIYSDGEYIYFKVFINETEYNAYRYNITDKKLIID